MMEHQYCQQDSSIKSEVTTNTAHVDQELEPARVPCMCCTVNQAEGLEASKGGKAAGSILRSAGRGGSIGLAGASIVLAEGLVEVLRVQGLHHRHYHHHHYHHHPPALTVGGSL